ncbi:uncharacterized protein Dana_GF22412 [Drosophila ananassae]|uniref:Uncharacterized protein n=1 Tax=Drosophila ananassae TaxID=7217 RepID=B3MWP5_DROAN|nr:uncharacterized protein LOC6505073 [Drosophila ananassae]EDV35030.1 uncharacterized protein Dana_GF22412 [Drosophila ananassae]
MFRILYLMVVSVVGIVASVSVLGLPHARASDLAYTEITPVTDDTRYTTIHPEVVLTEMDKVKHSKGNVVFTSGERTKGDRVIVNHYDSESFASAVDTEVLMNYPSGSSTGITLTCIEIYVEMSANDTGGYITSGGIGNFNVEVLLTSNLTRTFAYETFIYGY